VDFVKDNAKAIIAFVVGVLGNMMIDLASGNAPIPTNTEEWMRYLIFSFGSAAAVYGTRNKLTTDQVIKGLPKLPNAAGAIAAAVPAMVQPMQEAIVKQVVSALPPQAREIVGKYPFWG